MEQPSAPKRYIGVVVTLRSGDPVEKLWDVIADIRKREPTAVLCHNSLPPSRVKSVWGTNVRAFSPWARDSTKKMVDFVDDHDGRFYIVGRIPDRVDLHFFVDWCDTVFIPLSPNFTRWFPVSEMLSDEDAAVMVEWLRDAFRSTEPRDPLVVSCTSSKPSFLACFLEHVLSYEKRNGEPSRVRVARIDAIESCNFGLKTSVILFGVTAEDPYIGPRVAMTHHVRSEEFSPAMFTLVRSAFLDLVTRPS